MKHRIDPTVDCVFKALLGSLPNKDLLLDFLNSILHLPSQNHLADVELLNPYNTKEFESDKLTIVDIKAKDEKGALYQIEVQLALYPSLIKRILYTWSDLYQTQLNSGEDYVQLKPVISIWLCPGTFLGESDAFHHHFQPYDSLNKVLLTDHLSIHILELSKWNKFSEDLDSEGKWLYFFKEAKNWDRLPTALDTELMRKAMTVLKSFSEKERDYHLYQNRQNAIRQSATIARELEEMRIAKEEMRKTLEVERKNLEEERKAKEEERKAKEEERKAKEEAEAELGRLRELLRQKGINPD